MPGGHQTPAEVENMDAIFDHRPRPYTIVEDIVFECNLSSLQKLTLISLIKYAGKQSAAWPGLATLARDTSSSVRQLRRILKQLQQKKLLLIEHRPGRSSLYHIPEYTISQGSLQGIWNNADLEPTGDTTAGGRGHHDRGSPPDPGHGDRDGRPPCPDTPDTMAPEYYQEQYQGKSLSCKQASSRSSPCPVEDEREKFDQDLIGAWCRRFSIHHQPVSSKEQKAMDWMLYAAANNQLGSLTSPVGYLKTIMRRGFPQNFPPYPVRHKSNGKPARLTMSVEQQWQNLNPVHKQLFLEEAKAQTSKHDQLEKTAFHLFLTSLVGDSKEGKNTPCGKTPIKSPPTPRISTC